MPETIAIVDFDAWISGWTIIDAKPFPEVQTRTEADHRFLAAQSVPETLSTY